METQEDGWSRLKALLEESVWNRKQTEFIVAGLDPAVGWADTLKWLPDGLLPEWAELTPEQVQHRAMRAVRTAEMKLLGLPWIMTPFAWLCEAIRRKQVQHGPEFKPYVHPGVVPPWLPLARLRAELKLLVPPEFYPQLHRARERHARSPSAIRPIVRRHWDEWNLGERLFQTKAAFIAFVVRELDAQSSDADADQGSIAEWIEEWERNTFSPYGIMGEDRKTTVRAYGLWGLIRPVKA
jgi:hypothetical protein